MNRILSAVLLMIPVTVLAQISDAPVKAADQTIVTSRSLQEEFYQYRAISRGRELETKLEIAQRKFTQAKIELDRAKQLLKAGTITETKFAVVYYEYLQLEAEVINLPVEVVKARLTAEFHKWRVVEVGNPGAHHELELVEGMIKGLDSELQTLTNSLEVAKAARDLTETYWENGVDLQKKNAISKAQLELREVAFNNSSSLVKGIEQQMALVKIAQASFVESRERLSKQAPRP